MSAVLHKLAGVLRHPQTAGIWLLHSPLLRWVPDRWYLKALFYLRMGRRLNLAHPTTFNEKLQWLKLHDRRAVYTEWVDKYRVREHVARTLGEAYLVPLLGVWDDPDEIDFAALPERFVLKCTHNSGAGMCLCRDKTRLDTVAVRRQLKKGLRQDYYRYGREYPYREVPRRIIAEAYLEEPSGALKDYKLMCFNGRVEATFVCRDRFSPQGMRLTVMDREWRPLPVKRRYPVFEPGEPRPVTYETMVRCAETLAQDCPFMRVDFYEVDGHLYFSEITLFPGSGFERFYPKQWDEYWGERLSLPNR